MRRTILHLHGYSITTLPPEAISFIVKLNGNVYAEGIGSGFDAMKPFWHIGTCLPYLPSGTLPRQFNHRVPVYSPRRQRSGPREPRLVHGRPAVLDRPGQRCDSARPTARLSVELRGCMTGARVLPQASAEDADRVGEERSVLHGRGAKAYQRDLPISELHLIDIGHLRSRTRGDLPISRPHSGVSRHDHSYRPHFHGACGRVELEHYYPVAEAARLAGC